MPREFYSLSVTDDVQVLAGELQRILDSIARRLNYVAADGDNISFGGKQLTNVATGVVASDGIRLDQAFELSNLATVIFGTANQITITDNGDETITISIPSDAILAKLTTTAGRINNVTRITSTSYTVLVTDEIIFCDTDDNAIEVDLPAGVEGTHYKFINCGSSGNALTVDPNESENILGEDSGEPFIIYDGEVINIIFETTEGWR